jgi:hypothetical protein
MGRDGTNLLSLPFVFIFSNPINLPMAITDLLPTTELEAVNAMLSAIGEAPVDDVEAPTQADVEMAVTILRNTCREVQTMGWRFNTEFGLAIAPTVEAFEWTDPDGETVEIDIFVPPADMTSFTVTPIPGQILSTYASLLDLSTRPSKQYTVADEPVLVFYDRIRNRDGFPAGEREFLYIDPVFLFDYAFLPEACRNYLMMVAKRRFVKEVMGDQLQVAFTEEDENKALRELVRKEGIRDRYSLLDHPDSNRMFIGRPRLTGLTMTNRSKPVLR